MDMMVTHVTGGWMAWDLTDLLDRPLGRITEEPGQRFFIAPSGRGCWLMARVNLGPHGSLDDALTAIEQHTHGICHRAPGGEKR